MNIKYLGLAGALSMLPLDSSTNTQGVDHEKKSKQIELANNLNNHEGEIHPFMIASKDSLSIQNIDPDSIFVVGRLSEELLKTPLAMKDTKRNIGEYLGYNQYQTIMKKYNPKYGNNKKTINQLDTVAFPLVYDDIANSISHDLSTYLEDKKFDAYREKLSDVEDLIVVTKHTDGKYMLLYFKDKKLFLGTYASIGKGNRTKKGLFEIQKKIVNKRSSKYRNAPMPYSLQVHGNIFIHQGRVTGGKISHGCVRLPGCYAEILYYSAKKNTKTLIVE